MELLITQFYLDTLHKYYEESKNPLFAWEAFKACRDSTTALPDWVLEYIEDSASNLLYLTERNEMSDERASTEVYKALGMSKPGTGTFFSNYSELKRDTEIIRDYYKLTKADEDGKADGRMGHNKAVTEISEKRNVSEPLVNKVIYGSRQKLGDLSENYELESNEQRKKREQNKALRKKKTLEKQKLQT